MKILVTAFEPFNGRDMNPSQFILEELEAPEGAPQAYFSNLPVWDMVKVIQETGVEAAVSYTAGTYVCNHVMYIVLHEVATNYPEMKAGFIHVPFLPEQNPATGYTMELDDMVKGIQTILEYFKNNP